ncbi:MAG TPA: right-handed parallel beta-helix repeat-containing protein [Azospirillaceae bacterium]|nr:right-handed parallel beta-helix repeat-containing protein [Azospirillaceae bacterium]
MRGPLIALAVLAVCGALGGGPGTAWAQAPAAFHVSPAGNDGWSGRLPEPDAAGADGPFATLERARDAARDDAAVKHIRLRAGTYRLERPLDLTGDRDGDLTIEAFPGESPVLSGGVPVSDVSRREDGSLAVPLDRPPGLDVFAGMERLWPAASGGFTPLDPIRSGWLIAEAAADGANRWSFRFRNDSVDPSWLKPGRLIQVMERERLADDIIVIDRVDDRTIQLQSKAWYPLRDGSTWRLLAHPGVLKHDGTFAWDDEMGQLLVRPGRGRTGDIVVARTAPLIRIGGARRVTLRGLTFAHVAHDGAAVELDGAFEPAITVNRFVGVGTAVKGRGVARALIAGNEMAHLGLNGVELGPGSHRNAVVGNHIHHIGEIRKYAGGVMAFGVKDNRFAHNDIEFSARYGISIKNWSDDTRNLRNVVEYNRIRHVGRETADGGAIEMLGRSDIDTRTTVRHNIIEHTGGLATGGDGRWLDRHKGWGVFLDDLTNGVLVAGNFFRDTGAAAVFIHGGDRNRVENNIALLESPDARFIGLAWAPRAGAPGYLYDNAVVRNVVAATVPVPTYWSNDHGGFPVMGQNLLHNVGRLAKGGPNGITDANSLLADPRFVDPRAGDYRLAPDSPAHGLGIRDLPWSRIGRAGWRASPGLRVPDGAR